MSRRMSCFFNVAPSSCEGIYGVCPAFNGCKGFCFCVSGDGDAVAVEADGEGVAVAFAGDADVPECFFAVFECGSADSADDFGCFVSFEEGEFFFVGVAGVGGHADFSDVVSCGVAVDDFCGVAGVCFFFPGKSHGLVAQEGGDDFFECGAVSDWLSDFSFRRHGDCGLGEVCHFFLLPSREEKKKSGLVLRDREGASFLLPLFSIILLDV